MTPRIRSLLTLLAFTLFGCGSDGDGPGSSACSPACGAGSRCVDGQCVPSVDAGTDAQVDAQADAVPDGIDTDAPADCDGTQCRPGEDCVDGTCVCEGRPCASACCTGDDVCYLEQCTTPGEPCVHSEDCETEQYCESTIQRCLPSAGLESCEYKPPPGVFSPEVFWSWPQPSTPEPSYYQIIATPLVIALEKAPARDVPVVPAVIFLAGQSIQNARLRAVRGDTGEDLFHNLADVFVGQSQIAAGDLEGDGTVEIVGLLEGTASYCGYVGLHQGARLAAFDAGGQRLWVSDATVNAGAAAPALVDLDGDGGVEVIVGDSVFDNAGNLLWVASHGPGIDGCLQAAAASIAADIIGGGTHEVIIGATAYGAAGNVVWRGMQAGVLVPDGFPAVADFDADGVPEVVVVHGGGNGMSILRGDTGERICHAPGPAGASIGGGPPVIADFDGDNTPEIGVVYTGTYVVYESDCTVKWSRSVADQSGMTSSSVFDFDGDGRSEVVYTDEALVHVFKGDDGTSVFTLDHQSGTGLENPVVADIDADGHTEVVAIGQQLPSIKAFRDMDRNWVASRRVWNQHAYHVTNVGEDGSIPASETASWLAPRVNSYRANVQGLGTFDVPDLEIGDLVTATGACPLSLTAFARVFNRGARGVLPPVWVRFTLMLDGAMVATVEAVTTHMLLPGESELVSASLPLEPGTLDGYELWAEVDPDDGTGFGAVRECDEDNNTAGPTTASCPPGPK